MLFRLTEWRQAVKRWPLPLNVKDLQSFLGLNGHYRKFILVFFIFAEPLYKLCKKNVPFCWQQEQQLSCNWVAERLPGKRANTGLFQFQALSKIFHTLYWCKPLPRTRAVLSQQQQDGTKRVIAYSSLPWMNMKKTRHIKFCKQNTAMLIVLCEK